MILLPPPVDRALRTHARVLGETAHDYDALMALAASRSYVLLGEATHGTHEFYSMRADITRRLISELGFDAVAVEGDWPDVHRLNRYVQGDSEDALDETFGDFERFPAWMWRNRVVHDFVDWLHGHNSALPAQSRVGMYGMDLYSLYRSADAVIAYLESVDPEQAEQARHLYACLDHVRDPQDYGLSAAAGLRPACAEAATRLLADLVRRGAEQRSEAPRRDGLDAQFVAERNAHVVRDAEHYYRAMFGRRINTWNLRDTHMVETLLALRRQLRATGRAGNVVVWAHNSHLGDARATQMGQRGEWNVGQLLREQMGRSQVLLVGFTTYTGHVTAARDWDRPAERRWVRPAHQDSYEHALHASRLDRFYLPLLDEEAAHAVEEPRLERAIGVVYRPETELGSHYFQARLDAQFDAVFHVDETTALEPIDIGAAWREHEPPDTYPSGL